MWNLIEVNKLLLTVGVCLLCGTRIHNCLPVEFEDTAYPSRLGGQEWELHRWSMGTRPRENTMRVYHRNGRFETNATFDTTDEKEEKPRGTCVAPGHQEGHCKYFADCDLGNHRTNLSAFMHYACIVEGTRVGICCPDLDTDRTSMTDSSTAEENPKEDPSAWEAATDGYEGGKSVVTSASNRRTYLQNTTDRNGPSLGATRKSRRPRGCGMSTKSGTRIVGGRPADPKEWPWMVALLRKDAVQYCGGVLVTDRHVLTAAHCVYNFKPRDIRVRLGEYDFTRPDETRAVDFSVIEIRTHRDFDTTNYQNDIAIIKIHRPTTFNDYIWPICLPPVDQSFENKSGVVTGWGTRYYSGPASPLLMEVTVPIWPQEICARSLAQRITKATMCAGAYEGGRDACQGDSGGPLLHQLANGRWVNIGIVSWGIRCGEPGRPGIYTRVSSYLDWIFANAVF